jgi:hypothetical protein
MPMALAKTPSNIKTEEEIIRENMLSISRQLGVTCNTCHISENFKSDQKIEFKIAKEHIKITQLLIDSGFNGKNGPHATCYMCHRGELKPSHKMPEFPIK